MASSTSSRDILDQPVLRCVPAVSVLGILSALAGARRSYADLSVASVLSTFSSAHEIGTPSDIPTFVSYFTIIQWIWATQTYYDIRFQAEDVVHRVYKAAQICLFVYIGAASRRWDLSKLRDPDTIDNISDTDYLARREAGRCSRALALSLTSRGRSRELYDGHDRLHPLTSATGYPVRHEYVDPMTMSFAGKQTHDRRNGRQASWQAGQFPDLLVAHPRHLNHHHHCSPRHPCFVDCTRCCQGERQAMADG